MTNQIHVAVLMGGWSNERPVSLMSGNGVADALERVGYKVSRVDMDRNVAQVLAGLRRMWCLTHFTASLAKTVACRACST